MTHLKTAVNRMLEILTAEEMLGGHLNDYEK
jgi:hypothetical protein